MLRGCRITKGCKCSHHLVWFLLYKVFSFRVNKEPQPFCFFIGSEGRRTTLQTDVRPPQFSMRKFEINLVHAEPITHFTCNVYKFDRQTVVTCSYWITHTSMYSALVAYRFLLNAMAFSLLLRNLSKRAVVSFFWGKKVRGEVYVLSACVSV